MKNKHFIFSFFIFLIGLQSFAQVQISASQRTFGVAYLKQTQNNFIKSIDGLTGNQRT
jgi:hypothetical protein